jgi:chemotaxis protein methyltransferase CheR
VTPAVDEIEMRLLLDAIYSTYHYDFRQYASASLKRRLGQALVRFECGTISALQEKILHDRHAFPRLLEFLTVQVSDLFRDPEVFLAMRRNVLPLLATYPSLKLWVAGCSNGEEAYSYAILLAEEGLLDRTLIYATDINDESLERARTGIYPLEQIKQFTLNHRESGGKGSLSDYYHAAHDSAVMSAALRSHITFADHSLATDSTFSEMQLISCRNVLIYFDRDLQDRALGLFRESLCYGGFLCLGTKEALRFSTHYPAFDEFCGAERIFQKVER